ncbi:MAG: sulfotransferase domain-containing protein [Candidatus Obscuribacterales bacterium]|nr:sulfotransferase domain-containing protein [Steroidobacteraceae bacterium]
MFLSRYLERITGAPSVFGLSSKTAAELLGELQDKGWHPSIRSALHASSADLNVVARRFALFMARGRTAIPGQSSALLSDHGLHNFLRFLINPTIDEIYNPAQLIDWAAERQLTLVYLHRDICGIANSLAHFLAAGKSFLVKVDSLTAAAELVSNLYAPVLAEQMKQWQRFANDPRVISVQYEALIKDPRTWIGEICRRGNIPHQPEELIQTADEYPSWTYRRGQGGSWRTTFSTVQQTRLEAL